MRIYLPTFLIVFFSRVLSLLRIKREASITCVDKSDVELVSSTREIFPHLASLLPSPRWGMVFTQDLGAREISEIYKRYLGLKKDKVDPLWLLHQQELFFILDEAGGWQRFLLATYDVNYPLSEQSVMDAILILEHSERVNRYWLALVSKAEPISIKQCPCAEDLAMKAPKLWSRYIIGLKEIETFFYFGETGEF